MPLLMPLLVAPRPIIPACGTAVAAAAVVARGPAVPLALTPVRIASAAPVWPCVRPRVEPLPRLLVLVILVAVVMAVVVAVAGGRCEGASGAVLWPMVQIAVHIRGATRQLLKVRVIRPKLIAVAPRLMVAPAVVSVILLPLLLLRPVAVLLTASGASLAEALATCRVVRAATIGAGAVAVVTAVVTAALWRTVWLLLLALLFFVPGAVIVGCTIALVGIVEVLVSTVIVRVRMLVMPAVLVVLVVVLLVVVLVVVVVVMWNVITTTAVTLLATPSLAVKLPIAPAPASPPASPPSPCPSSSPGPAPVAVAVPVPATVC